MMMSFKTILFPILKLNFWKTILRHEIFPFYDDFELYNKIFLADLLVLIRIKSADKSHSNKKMLYFH